MNNNKTLLLVLVMSVVGFAGSCGAPAANQAPEKPDTQPAHANAAPAANAISKTAEGPAISVTAENLGREFQADPAAFDKKYKGRTLSITGQAILAGQTADKFIIMLGAVRSDVNSKSVNIQCKTILSDDATALGMAVDKLGGRIKKADGNYKDLTFPTATIKGVYDDSTTPDSHGEAVPIISIAPCELIPLH